MTIDRPSLRELRADLRDLYEDYAACLDVDALEEFPAFFTEDGIYQVIPRENYDEGLEHAPIWCSGRAMIEDRVTALREAAQYQARSLRHFISGVRVLGEEAGEICATASLPSARPRCSSRASSGTW